MNAKADTSPQTATTHGGELVCLEYSVFHWKKAMIRKEFMEKARRMRGKTIGWKSSITAVFVLSLNYSS